MAQELSSAERLLRTIRWEPHDRVPILSPVPYDPTNDLIEDRRPAWQREANFEAVLELVRSYCDVFCRARGLGAMFDRRFLLTPPEYIEVVEQGRVGNRYVVVHRIRTPKGELRTTTETVDGIHTSYYTEPLLKDLDDVERILSVPYHFDPPDLAPFFEHRARIGERGLAMVGVSTPMVCVSRMLQFEQFLMWCATERETIVRLVETAFERIYERLKWLLERGVGPVFWMGGSEQATPPMMSRPFFEDLVVKYDKQLMDLIHSYGAYVYMHCHGKIGTVFDLILDMGPDLLDPLEPPPDGDLELAEAKQRARGKIVLVGNIEPRDLEFADRATVREKVRRAICEGGKEGFILKATDTAFAPLSDRYRDNCIEYINAGLEFGRIA